MTLCRRSAGPSVGRGRRQFIPDDTGRQDNNSYYHGPLVGTGDLEPVSRSRADERGVR